MGGSARVARTANLQNVKRISGCRGATPWTRREPDRVRATGCRGAEENAGSPRSIAQLDGRPTMAREVRRSVLRGGGEGAGRAPESVAQAFENLVSFRNAVHNGAMTIPLARKGRGAATNPTGRFEVYRVEAADDGCDSDDVPSSPRTTLTPDATRRIIARNDSPDVPFDLVDQLELHAVQLLVRPDDPGPEQGDRDTQDRNGHRPPALAESLGPDAVQGGESGVEGEEQPARGESAGAHVLGRLHVELVLFEEVGGEGLAVGVPRTPNDTFAKPVDRALSPGVNQFLKVRPIPGVNLVRRPCHRRLGAVGVTLQ